MTDLTITQRHILEFIRFKTNKGFPFYGSNEYVANALEIKESSAKVLINKLIKDNYLIKSSDIKHKRILSLSGKEYPRMPWVNMSDVNKWEIQKKRDEYLKEYETADKWGYKLQAENDILQKRCGDLQRNYDELKKVYDGLSKQLQETFVPQYQAMAQRVKGLEKLLKEQYGLTDKQISVMLKPVSIPIGEYC